MNAEAEEVSIASEPPLRGSRWGASMETQCPRAVALGTTLGASMPTVASHSLPQPRKGMEVKL